jgi:hypothetical protein
LCTVTVGGDFDHPIVALLGSFFGEVSAENLTAALEATSVSVVCDPGPCRLALEGEVGVAATVLSVTENEDGTFTLELATGQEVITDDPEVAADLIEALDTLAVEWTLEAGTVLDAGDQIASLHEDGLGFGVIVKLFAMADESQEACASVEPSAEEPCVGVTVEELVEAFQSGMGMGQLFKEYGRPSMLGVGHVRQALNGEAEAGTTDLTGGAEGICNAREHGGQANANGLGEVCESTSEGQVQADQDQQPGAGGQGNGHGGGNGGGQGGGNGGGQGGGNGGGNGSGGGNGGGNGKGGRP